MKPQGWDASWYQPGESLWSVSNKLAYVAAASVRDVFSILAGVFHRARESWLFPSAEQAASVCESLGLPVGLARTMFAAVGGAPSLPERSYWQLAIRFCPQCLAGFMHRATFQDRRTLLCPVHGCALVDACPHCRLPLDPLCSAAWVCNYCQGPLVEPGRDWPAQFRSGRGGAVPSPRTRHPSSVHDPQGLEDLERRSVVQEAYEEHSALCSTLLGRHVDCVQHESEAINAAWSPVWFDCPLAACAIFAATQLGFAAQCADGAWVPVRPQVGRAHGLRLLEGILSDLPQTDRRPMARMITRQWFAEALASFGAAAASGSSSATWVPSPDPLRDGSGRLKREVTQELLEILAQRAAHGCPRR